MTEWGSTLQLLTKPPPIKALWLCSAVAVNAIRGVDIVAAGENEPVERSKISALPITLPLRLSENCLIVAPPLKPPSSSTFEAGSAAAAAPARLATAWPVAKNWLLDGSKNSAVAKLMLAALAPPAVSTAPADGIERLALLAE